MSGELVLIIEDNELNRKLARDLLEVRGYQTLESTSGEDGVRLAKERLPALILLDIHLPGIDGIETFRRLRDDRATASIPVVVVTASAMTDDRKRIKQAGFDGYLSKPIDIQQFLATVAEMIATHGAK